MPKSVEVRNWTFTLFYLNESTPVSIENYKLFDSFMNSMYEKGEFKYCKYQLELCPTTKKLHIQGWLSFKRSYKIGHMKKLFNKKDHYEEVNNVDAIDEYCCKSESWVEPYRTVIGHKKLTGQGRRSDLNKCKELLDSNQGLLSVFENNFADGVRYHRGFEKYLQLKLNQPRNWVMEVIVIIGPSGSGKSRSCYDNEDSVFCPIITKDKIWFDNYNGETTVLLDDVRTIDITFILQLCDRYPMRVECKGGSMNFCSKKIYITSNTHYEDWFPKKNVFDDNSHNIKAFERRITKYINMYASSAIPCKASDAEVCVRNPYDAPFLQNDLCEIDKINDKLKNIVL